MRQVRFLLTSRYSCRHSHLIILQPALQLTFTALLTLPYQTDYSCEQSEFLASVNRLSSINFRRQLPSTSELLRFLSRMAASEPTSWLSKDDDFLTNLAVI